MKTKINGWVRLGLVISCVWLIFIAISVLDDVIKIDGEVWLIEKDSKHTYVLDGQSKNGFFEFKKPKKTLAFVPIEKTTEKAENSISFDDLIPAIVEFNYRKFLIFAFSPILCLWLLAFAFVWIKNGFREVG